MSEKKFENESSDSETFVASGRTPKAGLSRVESGQCEKYYLKLKWYFEFSDKMSEKKFQESLKQLLLVGARQPKAGLSRVDASGGHWSVREKCFLAERKTHSRSPGWLQNVCEDICLYFFSQDNRW